MRFAGKVFSFGTLCVSLAVVSAGELAQPEGPAHGFPALRALTGNKLADGEFTQWLEHDALHVRITYNFGHEHKIQEDAVFRQSPQLVQEQWAWQEVQSGRLTRKFELDFKTGMARGEVISGGEPKHWSARLKVEPGRTFSGFGFTLAIKSVRERLLRGDKVQFQAIAFSPKPREVTVEISYAGLYQVPMSGRKPLGECFVIHPNLPAIARVFVSIPDTRIWLTHPPPAEFLRWEGPLIYPTDPVVRVDLLPDDPSGPAEPVSSSHQ